MEISKPKYIYLLLLALVWGSSFILIKRGLTGLSPMQLGGLRMFFAASFVLMIGFSRLKNIQKRHWKYLLLTAMCGTFFPVFLFSIAQTQISSTVSAVLNSLTPLYTLLIGVFVYKMGFLKQQLWGVALGLVGCGVLIFQGAADHPEQNYAYAVLIVISSILYAANANFIKNYLSELDSITITVGNFTILLLPAIIILFLSNFHIDVQYEKVYSAVPYVAVLGVLGTAIANIFYYKLIAISSPVFASSVTYMIPVVAFGWGVLDNESMSFLQFVGALVILVGVYLSSKK